MNTQSKTPPLEPIYIPESPNGVPVPKEALKETSRMASIRAVPSMSPEEIALIAKEDVEKALRSAAILLHWASIGGTEQVNGALAVGIAEVLFLSADRLRGGHE